MQKIGFILDNGGPIQMTFHAHLIILLNSKSMEKLPSLSAILFARVLELSSFTLHSQIYFTIVECARFVLKEIFVLLAYLTPFSLLCNLTQNALQAVSDNPFALTVSITLTLTFLGVGYSYGPSVFLCGSLRGFLQHSIVWLDLGTYAGIAVSIAMAKSPNQSSFMVVGNTICIALLFIFSMLKSVFRVSKHYQTDNLTHRRPAPLSSLANLGNLILVIGMSIKYDPEKGNKSLMDMEMAIFSLAVLLLALLKAKERLYLRYYITDYSNNLSSCFYLLEINAIILVGLYSLFGLKLIRNNILYLLALMTALGYLCLRSYSINRKVSFHLTTAKAVTNHSQALVYLDYLSELVTKSRNLTDDVTLTMIRQGHILNCTEPECFCTQNISKGEFIVSLVKQEVKDLERSFARDPDVLLSALYLKVTMYSDYPQALSRMEYIATSMPLNMLLRYFKAALTDYISQYIDDCNHNIASLECESVMELEKIKVGLQRLIEEDIELKSKQWRYFSRRTCHVSQLEQICNSSLHRVKSILQCHQAHHLTYKKSKQFNLLLLFYYTKVSFSPKTKQILKSLYQISRELKHQQLHQLKEFRKVLYSRNCCALQSMVDTNTIGIITETSRNIDAIFGRTRNELIGQNINQLMPQFLGKDHDVVLKRWRSSGTWRTMGKLKEVYCLHKEGYCFSVLLYLKLIVKNNALYLITNMFQLNSTDYLLLDKHANIQGMGRQLQKILGQDAVGLNLDKLVNPQNASETSLLELSEDTVHQKIFLSVKDYADEASEYKKALQASVGTQRQTNHSDFYDRLFTESQDHYLIDFKIKRFSCGQLPFWVLQLKEAKTFRANHQTFHDIDELMSGPKPLSQGVIRIDNTSSFEESLSSQRRLVDVQISSSVASPVEKENYALVKTIKRFQEYLVNPILIHDARLTYSSFWMIVLAITLVAVNMVSLSYYKQTLLEVKGIISADGTVSNIMQTTQMGYNSVFALRSQLIANSSSFQSSLQSARHVQDSMYKMIQKSLMHIVTDITPLTKTRLHGYLQKQAKWISASGGVQKIKTKAYLRYMYHTINQMMREIEQSRAGNSTEINLTLLSALATNFPQMKRLSEFFLIEYQQLADLSHNLLDHLTYGLMGVSLLLSGVIVLMVNEYYKFRFHQKTKSLNHFALLPNFVVENMKKHYGQLQAVVFSDRGLATIEQNQEHYLKNSSEFEQSHEGTEQSSIKRNINLVNDDKYLKWIVILLVFLVLNGMNYWATTHIRGYLAPSRAVIRQSNELMRSQNQLIESYVEMKEAYYLGQGMTTEVYDRLMLLMRQDENKFASVVYSVTNIFTSYDSHFKPLFIETVTDPVCSQVAGELSQFQNQKCLNELPLKLLESGVLIAMNFFQRHVRQALEDLHLQHLGARPPFSGDYFRQQQFTEVDNMLIYLFKIFQLTQRQVQDAYDHGIELVTDKYKSIISFTTASVLLMALAWVFSVNYQKRALSLLYGHLLLVPVTILKNHHRMTMMLREALEDKDK